jgi:hypothetical protein
LKEGELKHPDPRKWLRHFILFVTLLIHLFLQGATASAAELKATVDRNQLSQDEHLLFTLELINSDTRLRAEGVKPNIDLSLLSDDFTLSRPTADSRYNIYQGRGRSSSTLTVTLFPRRAGRLTIPSFTVDGLRTKAIAIEVSPRNKNAPPELFVRSGSNKSSVWVNEQLVVYLDLYHRVALDQASLGDNLETEPTQIELLPNWKLEQASRHESVQGYDYEVERTAWAIFPQQSGALTVQLPDVWAVSKNGGEQKQRLEHQRLTIEVKTLPAGVPADIIIGRPELEQTRLPLQTKQHQLTHWTVTLKAPVAVTSLPEQLPGVTLPEGLRLYPDTARRDTTLGNSGIVDRADYVLSVMPLAAGEFELPPLRLPYFDPESGQADYVELPGQPLSVVAAPLPEPHGSLTLPAPEAAISEAGLNPGQWLWPIATTIFALLWLATLFLWQRSGRDRNVAVAAATPKPLSLISHETRHPLQQQLLDALASRTLEEGLTRWQAQFPEEQTVAAGVRALQRLCYGKGTESEVEAERLVKAAIATLNLQHTAPGGEQINPWRPEAFTPGR